MIKFTGIHHLALATSDMDKTIRFWRDLIGMRLVAAIGKPGYRHYFFEISENDMLAFFEWPDIEPIAEKDAGAVTKGPFAFDHVCFGVERMDELWEIKGRLEAAEIWTSEVVDNGFMYSLFSFDPNGISIEFTCTNPDMDIRKNPLMADRSPSETALEGMEPHNGKWPHTKEIPQEDRKVYKGAILKMIKK
jgi:catechol 2,3-dioxygenase-like lactoylglutathione lyase family enzyme